jgi:hypothetical protein
MKENVELLKTQHPILHFNIFDIQMCRTFIKTYFSVETLDAYDSLIPYAFKSDLWRLCVLYIYGGIYLDIKFKCVDNFRLTHLLFEEHYSHSYGLKSTGLSNGLLVCKPNNKLLLNAISYSIYIIKNKLNGKYYNSIVGPVILGIIVKPHIKCTLKRIDKGYSYINNDIPILESYPEYRKEQFKQNKTYWSKSIRTNKIYNNGSFKDFIEIGTCDFNTEIQNADNITTGVSIEPVKYYLDKLPFKEYIKKINVAISDSNGICDIFFMSKEDITKYKFPEYISGCNSIDSYNRTVLDLINKKKLDPQKVIKSCSVPKKTLMTLISDLSITGVYYLKIDTEGHDCIILKQFMNEVTDNSILPHKILFKSNTLTSNKDILKIINVYKEKGYDLISSDSTTLLQLNLNKLNNKTKFTGGIINYYIPTYPLNYDITKLPHKNTLESAMEYCKKYNCSGISYQRNIYQVRAGNHLIPYKTDDKLTSWIYV